MTPRESKIELAGRRQLRIRYWAAAPPWYDARR